MRGNAAHLGSVLLFFALASGCNDPRTASELLGPDVEKSFALSPQGTRWGDGALVFTTNLEFVVVRKIDVHGVEEQLDAPIASRVSAFVRFREGEPEPGSVQEVVLGISGDRIEVSLKAAGLRLSSLRVQAGPGERFRPGDELVIDAVVERTLGIQASMMSAAVSLPAFRTPESDYEGDPIRGLAWLSP
ncbi:MAG TPA: hypothetical protein VM598_05970 [Bdellovibrionota bacterium]|nr:hypothetical protein [Bdellovibrionota bacterium]